MKFMITGIRLHLLLTLVNACHDSIIQTNLGVKNCYEEQSFGYPVCRLQYQTSYRTISVCCKGYIGRPSEKGCFPLCHQSCFHGICDKPDICKCELGWYGNSCNLTCPVDKWGKNCNENCNCKNGAKCDPATGVCSCGKGWRGQDCSLPCEKGHYGYFCEGKCYCENNGECNHVDGTCKCSAGYQGEHCRQKCATGTHGYQCMGICQCQNEGLCNHEDGTCDCANGWTGTTCNESCSEDYYGKNCSEMCDCSNITTCHHATGECFCAPGYHGDACENPCPFGKWGLNCTQECSCINGYCSVSNGNCICYEGFNGTYCEGRVCPPDQWGQNCSNECTCGNETYCHPLTGECLTPKNPDFQIRGNENSVISMKTVAGIISSLIIIALLLTAGLIYYKHLRFNKEIYITSYKRDKNAYLYEDENYTNNDVDIKSEEFDEMDDGKETHL